MKYFRGGRISIKESRGKIAREREKKSETRRLNCFWFFFQYTLLINESLENIDNERKDACVVDQGKEKEIHVSIPTRIDMRNDKKEKKKEFEKHYTCYYMEEKKITEDISLSLY